MSNKGTFSRRIKYFLCGYVKQYSYMTLKGHVSCGYVKQYPYMILKGHVSFLGFFLSFR